MWSSPRNPHRKPKPSAPDVSGSYVNDESFSRRLLERLAQVRVLVAHDGVQAAEHHRLRVAVPGSAAPGFDGGRDGLADLRLARRP